ncbi:DNA polymerase [Paracoccus sp. AK26]|nr:DNA polymerase [Paracoccus sp. AK26]
MSRDLASVGPQGAAFPLKQGRGDEARHGSAAGDPWEVAPVSPWPREIYMRDLHHNAIRVKGRDFR